MGIVEKYSYLLGVSFSMEHSIEVLKSSRDRGGRRNRCWSVAEKARIVAETLEPGATVSGVAARHGLLANHLSSWRALARNGKLVLPASNGTTAFAPVVMSEPPTMGTAQASGVCRGFTDVHFGSVMIRLDAAVCAHRVAEIVLALTGPR
jgi:transposase